jgi:hypothetical protein
MAKAIHEQHGLTVAQLQLGRHGTTPGSVKQQTHDGDTLIVQTAGNFSVRFLGVDAPEISFTLPGETLFTQLISDRWEQFLRDPFGNNTALAPELRDYLSDKAGPGAAANHATHAAAAEDALEALISQDMAELGKTKDNFELFMVFAHEVTDRYGRLLGFINRYQASGDRPLTYNERLLQRGLVSPYFIWPNVNPFRKAASLIDAVPAPSGAAHLATNDTSLRRAREWVQKARAEKTGLYASGNPLRLESFELCYLARNSAPNRWVIDLSKSNNQLLPPQDYYRVEHTEDRLFIPAEFVPLFVEAGWKRAA